MGAFGESARLIGGIVLCYTLGSTILQKKREKTLDHSLDYRSLVTITLSFWRKMMLELQSYEHHAFPAELNCQAVSFIRVVWPHIGGGMVRQMFATKLDTVHFVLVEGGLLHSYAAVVHFHLTHADEEYEACGLTSVFSYPASRNKGYGQQVVDAATNSIRASGADIGLLLTGSDLEHFYAQSGWETIMSAPLIGVS